MEPRKSLQELTLLDRFLFDEAMEKPENMRAVLEIILGKDVVLKSLPQTEKEERISEAYRFVKLDVWAQDEEHISPELKELLYFMEHTNDDATACKCERVAQLKESIRKIQNNEEVAMRYLHELEEQNASRQEGRAEGLAEGRAEGITEGIAEGTEATKRIFKLHIAGKSDEEISTMCGIPLRVVEETLR